ncbi:alpha/beta hydrolase [Lentzea sp. NBRC 102530]|uniref:alpha/beta hydrolase n=1 Tax=Lentzea sp. NBRC 102530 TaxID=3032201 RepID=UPI0025544FE7|nr:alpha/beta hydrolase [Lentzea sp. NBRC 102530]
MASKIAYGSLPSQFGVLHLPAGSGPFPVVVMVHGGWWAAMWDDTAVQPLISDLVGEGYAVWSVEYRRMGEAGAGWPGTFSDIAAAVDFVGSLDAPLDLSRVAVVGHSAGGHLATWTAHRGALPAGVVGAEPSVALVGVVSVAGVLDLVAADGARLGTELADLSREPPRGAPGPSGPDFWPLVAAGVGEGMTRFFVGTSAVADPGLYALVSPAEMGDAGVPVLAVHGSADEVIPQEFSRTYAARHALGEFVDSPGGDHFSVIEPDSHAWSVARKWLADKLS